MPAIVPKPLHQPAARDDDGHRIVEYWANADSTWLGQQLGIGAPDTTHSK